MNNVSLLVKQPKLPLLLLYYSIFHIIKKNAYSLYYYLTALKSETIYILLAKQDGKVFCFFFS